MNNSYLSRVAQADAAKLDYEVVEIFKNQIYEVTKYLPAGFITKYDPEISLMLRMFMFKFSVAKNHATFGQQLLAIKYANMTEEKLYLYAFLTHGLKYLRDRGNSFSSRLFENWNPTKLIDRMEGLIYLAGVVNFLAFLRSGEKPLLVDRVLDLKQITTVKRYMNNNIYTFLNREILWHSFIELLVIVIPLVNYHSLLRRFKKLNPWSEIDTDSPSAQIRVYTMATKCPHCKEKPVIPYHMGCAHIFCYYCLKGNIEADSNYDCPVCNYSGKKCVKFIM